jgi:hypothetical protein
MTVSAPKSDPILQAGLSLGGEQVAPLASGFAEQVELVAIKYPTPPNPTHPKGQTQPPARGGGPVGPPGGR